MGGGYVSDLVLYHGRSRISDTVILLLASTVNMRVSSSLGPAPQSMAYHTPLCMKRVILMR